MAIELKTIQVEDKEVVAKICGKCGKRVIRDNFIEWQEFMHWENRGGYGSIWGDGITARVDLCQQCTYDLLEDYAYTYLE